MKKYQYSLCHDWKHHFQPFGRDGAVKIFYLKDESINQSVNELITEMFVEQPLALPGSANDL